MKTSHAIALRDRTQCESHLWESNKKLTSVVDLANLGRNPGGRNWLSSDNTVIKHRWMTDQPLFNCFPVTQIRFREQYVSQRTNQKFVWENLSISFDLGSLQYSESQGIEGRDHLQVSRPKPRGVWLECEVGKGLRSVCFLLCLKRSSDLQQKLDSICALYLIFTGFRLRPSDSV